MRQIRFIGGMFDGELIDCDKPMSNPNYRKMNFIMSYGIGKTFYVDVNMDNETAKEWADLSEFA